MVFYTPHHLLDPEDTILIAGDETVITKSGKETYGLAKFFSALYSKPIAGLSFFCLSLISVKKRISYPVMMEQIIKEEEKSEKGTEKTVEKKTKKRGRPKGSKNKNKREVELPPYLIHIQNMLKTLLLLLGIELKLAYFLLDGAFGNNYALQMVQQCSLHIISKLRCDAALHFPYEGTRRKKYGQKLDYSNIPVKYLKSSIIKNGIQTNIYHRIMWHKLFPDKLNIIIILKINLNTKKWGHVVLFSSDLILDYDKVIDYYHLHFQIEFNFRDAKQFWGLEDFMNIKKLPVFNATNLAMFMVNLSQLLICYFRPTYPAFSVNDLKAHSRGYKYVNELLKLFPKKPDPIFIEQLYAPHIALLGSINTS